MIETPMQTFLNQLQDALRAKPYNETTEQVYIRWVRRYIIFHNHKHPQDMGEPEVEAFLNHLATVEKVSTSTQNQALSALSFTYKYLVKRPLSKSLQTLRVKPPKSLPVVLTASEIKAILNQMAGPPKLVAQLLYGSGLRLREGLRLRVKDLDFEQERIVVWDEKGNHDRFTLLARNLVEPLQAHLINVKYQHEKDLLKGNVQVYLPEQLEQKYPKVQRDWDWQYVFPGSRCRKFQKGFLRHHLDETVIQKALKIAVKQAGITKDANCHTLRHTFAAQILQNGYDIRTVQELLGHKNIKTTMVYTTYCG
jgi:integron integrase